MISARKWSCECKRPVFLNQKKNDMQILMDSMNHISNQLKINIIKCKLDNKKHLRLIWNLRCSASLPKNANQFLIFLFFKTISSKSMDLYLIAIKDFFVMVNKHRKYGKKIRAKK